MFWRNLAALFFLILIPAGGCLECASGWSNYGNYCYVLLHERVTWYEGKIACATVHGRLAEVTGNDDNNFIANLLQNHRVNYAWIGLEDLLVEGKFVWASDGNVPMYTNFHSGQPNNGGHDEDCVSIRDNGQWYDDHCHDSEHPVLCQAVAQSTDEVVG